MWPFLRACCPPRHVVCVSVCFVHMCVLYVCVPRNEGSKLTQWQFLAERQRGPAIQQQRLCCFAPLGLLWTSFSLSFSPFFSEPIFLSEVLIWGAGQWGEGRERDQGREERGREEVRSGDCCRRTALCSFFPRLLSWASEAPIALEPSSKSGRERGKKRAQWSVQLESSNSTEQMFRHLQKDVEEERGRRQNRENGK